MTNRQNESLEGREVGKRDFKSQETISLTANTLGIVGTSHKGPAFVPHTFLTYEKDDTDQGVLNTFEETFGSIDELKEANVPQFTAFEWFNQGGEQLTFTRILGMGLTGKPDNEGIVQGSGFIVGQSVVSGSTTLGKVGGNSYATAANASAGKTHFIGSTFENNQFTDVNDNKISTFNDYLQQIGFPNNTESKSMITDVVFCPSGSEMFMENSPNMTNAEISAVRNALHQQTYTVSNLVKSTSLSNPNIFIRGLVSKDFNMVKNLSDESNRYDITHNRFNESVYNRDPDYILHKGHLNYASYYPQLGSFSFNDTNKFFIVSGNNAPNTPSYEDFQSTFTTAKTPWIVSQPLDREGLSDNRVDMHTKCEKLFRFYALDDGEIGNRYRIRVQPQRKGDRKTRDWTRFTVKVWELNKEMTGFNELLEYRDLTLDPNSTDYIGFVFGTKHEYFNIDANKVQTEGRYETGNSHLRVEVNPKIEFKQIEAYEIVPSGFMPYPRLNTSGLELQDQSGVIQKPLDYVSNILLLSNARGSSINNTELIESKYWGVLFDKTRPVFIRDVEINSENYQLRSQAIINTNTIKKHYYSYTKYFQDNYNELNKNVWVKDLEDNNIDTFNAFFHLEKILYTGNETDSQFWKKAMYRRDGINPSSIESLVSAKSHYQYINIDQFLKSSNGQDSPHTDYLSFDFFTYGGFDGVNILDRDKRLMNQSAFIREIEDEGNNGSTNGPTRFAYELGHKNIVDDANCEIDLLVFPDIGHNVFNKEVSTVAGENRRYLSVLNAAEHFSTGMNLNANLHIVDPTDDDPSTRISLIEGVGNSLAGGINATVSSVSGYYYNNKYTLNVCNTLEGVIVNEVNITDKLVTVLPSYKVVSATASSFRPVDSIREFNDSLLNIKKVINTTFTDSFNNSYSSLLKTTLAENLNFVISEGSSIKLNSGNTSIYDRNSLSRFAHNTRILIDIKKNIKYGIFNSDLLFKNNSKIENVNANLNLLLTSILQTYVNNQIIQDFFVEIKTGQTRKEKLDVLNNILRTKIAISLFGKSNDNIEEFNLASILNTTQNNLTETSGQDIILPSI